MAIFHSKEKRDLAVALKFYCDREHLDAHSAKADVQATIDILKHQLLMYEELEPNTSFLHDAFNSGENLDSKWKFKRDEIGEIVFNFGKHFGRPAASEPDYLKWMYTEGDFRVDTKMVAKKIYMNVTWEVEIKKWLEQNKILSNYATASALYATVKFKKDIFPFAITIEEGEKAIINYLIEPLYTYTFSSKEAQNILLNLLDRFLSSS